MDEPGITPFVDIFVSELLFFLFRVGFLGQNFGPFRYDEQTKCFLRCLFCVHTGE